MWPVENSYAPLLPSVSAAFAWVAPRSGYSFRRRRFGYARLQRQGLCDREPVRNGATSIEQSQSLLSGEGSSEAKGRQCYSRIDSEQRRIRERRTCRQG